jgi:hypothetical protein
MKTFFGLICIGLWAAAIGGWIANIVKVFGMLGGDVSAMFIARLVGIFAAPLGAILGFC